MRDQQGEVRYYRKEGGTRVAVRLVNATNAALDQIELEPGVGSPTLGKLLGIPGFRTWRVAKFPLLWCYFERGDHLDVVRLLGESQNLAAILGDEFASN
jgi:toxin ParE1/3/4